jgi:two-component system LytT family response regulator
MVVDDEALARRRLKRLLALEADVRVIGECADGRTALRSIAAEAPDLVLLDVQMPEVDGVEVARRLRAPRPAIVFVTAFDHYAVQAFEIHAVDYLLKPVSRDRLADALARVRERRRRPSSAEGGLSAAIDALSSGRRPLTRVPVRDGGRVDLVDVAAIDWIEAANNYVVLHAGPRTHILRGTMADLESALDPRRFLRIHRSTIVALDGIVRLEVASRGDYDVVLRDGTTLTLSRTHRGRLEHALGRKF